MHRGQSLRIGRLFGIDIMIDWTWLIIFALITYSLGASLGVFQPEWDPAFRWAIAVISSLLFFVSVLAHELAHSLMSQAHGNPVDSITLFLFGGVAKIREEPDSARSEFLMAIAGPAMSVLIGFVLLAFAGAVGRPLAAMTDPADVIAQLSGAQVVALWVGSINIVLGLFNMLPGFPLDGGRVLRSVLWAVTDDLRGSTRWATRIGQGLGWLMMAGGVSMVFGVTIPFFGTGLVGGLWLAFIGWYLNNASAQSYQQVVVQDILKGIRVERIMRKDPPTASAWESVETLVYDRIMGTDDHSFPVFDHDELAGMVTLSDVRATPREQWPITKVRDIMTPYGDCTVTASHEDAAQAMSKLATCDVRELPVIDDGVLIGVLRRRDLIQWLRLHGETAGGGSGSGSV